MNRGAGPTVWPLPLSAFFVAVASFAVAFLLRFVAGKWVHLPVHSALETAGGLIALAVAVVLVIRDDAPYFRWAAAALVSMGALDLVHACTTPGPPFFWSRALPTIIGGLGFTLVWLPDRVSRRVSPRIALGVAIGITLPLCLLLVLWPGLWPPMFSSAGIYTPAAKLINVTGGIGFFASAAFFLLQHRRSGRTEHLVFANHCILFGAAGVLFGFSALWDSVWWSYHVLRFLAYCVVLAYVVRVYRMAEVTRRAAVEAELAAASERLRLHAENSPVALIEWDPSYRVTRWTASAERVFGWTAEDVEGRRPSEWRFIPEDHAAGFDEVMKQLVRGADRLSSTHEHYRKDGARVWCEWHSSVLRDAHGQIVSIMTLTLDVTVRLEAEDALRRAKIAAETANRVKDDFLATISHELRTPMTTLRGWVRMLQLGLVSDADRASAVDQIAVSANTQSELIEQLLDVSRLMSGKLAVTLEPLDLTALMRDAAEAILPAARARGIRVELHDAGPLMVNGDPLRLRQSVDNLLSNALKFTAAEGVIEIATREEGTHALLSVRDNGHGIDAAFLPHVFERFRQEDSSSTRLFGGLGIGLSIVSELIAAHDGSIHAESAGRDQGTMLTIKLPLLRVAQSNSPRLTEVARS